MKTISFSKLLEVDNERENSILDIPVYPIASGIPMFWFGQKLCLETAFYKTGFLGFSITRRLAGSLQSLRSDLVLVPEFRESSPQT